jgi:hypothetical protein
MPQKGTAALIADLRQFASVAVVKFLFLKRLDPSLKCYRLRGSGEGFDVEVARNGADAREVRIRWRESGEVRQITAADDLMRNN